MKRLLSLMLAVLCLAGAVPAALAAGRVYELPDFNMTVEAPDGWIVFTQDIEEDDPNLALIGAEAKGFSDYLRQSDIYLYATKTDPLVKIYLTINDLDWSKDLDLSYIFDDQPQPFKSSKSSRNVDFNNISDDALLPMIESAMKEQEKLNEGVTFTNFSVYNHKQTKFVVYDVTGSFDDVSVYGKQYVTLINGQDIIITLQSYGSKVTGSLSHMVQDIVDSIFFTKVSSKPADITAIILIIAGIVIAAVVIGIIAHIVKKARLKKLPPREKNNQSFGLGDISLK